jgi:hypothetical protein
MKTYEKVLFGLGIVFLVLLHQHLFSGKEGFFDDSSKYSALQRRLSNTMEPYCKISAFVRDQLKTMIAASGDSSTIESTYKSMYSCSDKLASSRPSCLSPNMSMNYIGCETYLNLPPWSSDGTPTLALMKITNDLPERLVRESEWFAAIIKQLNESLALAANPPTSLPSEYKEISLTEGFYDSVKCSPEAAEYKKSQKLKEEASSCSIPSVNSEIDRVNSLLNSSELKTAIGKMDGLLSGMLKIQSDIEKVKNSWQKDGPTKKFPQFQGGDRTASFLFSMQQNQM